jgi:hypothetical protein
MASFSTIAVRAFFSILSTGDEVPFVALNGTNGCELLGYKIGTTAPGYASGTVHARRQMTTGDAYLKSVRWSPGQVAECDIDVYGVAANGSTDPVVADTITLPTLSTNTEQLVLSGLTIGATQITRVQAFDVSIDHKGENNVEPICFDRGLPYPVLTSRAGVGGQTEITATIDTLDLTTSISNGTVTATFTTITNLGVGIGSTTATVTINGVLVRESTIEGKPGVRRLVIRGTYDGINSPVTIATA